MESQKDEMSEVGENEDLPSDFFDDFNKDEFMEGLSVIDEWDETNVPNQNCDTRTRIDVEALDSVKDLRELIGDNHCSNSSPKGYPNKKYKWVKPNSPTPNSSDSKLDNFIKPGSRRDPSKTNEAIKKDKEVKVQQFLVKCLESSDELRPPGTELDEYYEEDKKKKEPILEENSLFREQASPARSKEHLLSFQHQRNPRMRHSPRPPLSPRQRFSPRHRVSPRSRGSLRSRVSPRLRLSPRPRRSPHLRQSPRRFSPRRSPRRTVRNPSPRHRNPIKKFSPSRNNKKNFSLQRRSPRRYSPTHTPRREHRSRSPRRRQMSRRSHSRSRSRSQHRDNSFLYPHMGAASSYPSGSYQPELGKNYAPPMHPEYPGIVPGYPYQQALAYGSGFTDPYNYGAGQVSQTSVPGSLPMANVNPVTATNMLNPVQAPSMVPAPALSTGDKATPYDALAQLVAEGKISQEDYLKLTPNKGQASTMDTKTRVMVLTRCNQAILKLDNLLLPNRLMVNKTSIVEDKFLAPKYCSPLKRQVITEFNFTKGSVSPAHHNKQLVESIISTLGLDKVVSKYKKKLPKDMKDAVVQTTKVQCEVCEIRESTKYHDVSTSTEPEYFTSTVHTQVVEQDLFSSKSIFNPSGSIGEGAAISISHLTPAQLVSQLAARAKTLKQPDPSPPSNQYARRPPSNYDYDGRGGQQYHQSYNNYRY